MDNITAREAISEHVAAMVANNEIAREDTIQCLRAGNTEASKLLWDIDEPLDAEEVRKLTTKIFTEIV